MKLTEKQRVFAVTRDDEFYSAHRYEFEAEAEASRYRPGSKHKWDVVGAEISFPRIALEQSKEK